MSERPARKYICREHLEERLAIRLEHIRHPTPLQEHQALNDTLRDLTEIYGELDVPQWPRASGS